MNKGYTYIDGKVIISDENGNHTQSEYYNNLDKVLVQENVIEEMEGKIQELTKESKKYPESEKKYKPLYLYSVLGAAILVMPHLFWLLTGVNPYLCSIDTVFGPVNQALFYASTAVAIGIPFGSIFTWIDYSNFKERAKIGKGISSELEFLKFQIEKEKETLVSLQKEKTRNKDNTEFRSTQVDDKQQLEALRNYLDLYYDLGYNREKYYRYYQQGRLDEKLQKYYDETEIELTKQYLEEKGPVLVKKINNSKRK